MRSCLLIFVVLLPVLVGGCASDSGEGTKSILGAVFGLFVPDPSPLSEAMDEGFGFNNEANAIPTGPGDVRG
jgi:hypothetical protein